MFFFSALIKTKKILFDALFPALCVNCAAYLGESSDFLCTPCLASIRIHDTMFCPVCRRRLPENKRTCHKSSGFLLAPASNYDIAAMRELIHALKYKGAKGAAEIIALLLGRYASRLDMDMREHLMIPIPLSPKRMRERGFNQAELIASHAAKHLGIEMRPDILRKTKNTPPQTGLQRSDRKANLRGCFSLQNPSEVGGKNIILVDDVFTSGATMEEAARVLKVAGAKRIIALVAAQA